MSLHHMAASDYVGIGVAAAFGIWWIAFPGSVATFYTRFHRGQVKVPRSIGGVRLAGVLWTLLVLGVFLSCLRDP